MQVNASIDEADIGRIQPGQPVSFRVDAFPGRPFTGHVVQVRLEPVVEQNVVSYVTVIRVPNPDLQLRPGMTASVTVEVARADDTLRVPAAALRFRPTGELLARFGEEPADAAGATPATGNDDVRPARAERPGSSSAASASGAHVWIFDGVRMQEVPVDAGVSDGTSTAIAGRIAEGELVVVGAASAPSAVATRTTSPLIPSRPGRTAGRQGAGGARQ
jgi:HlyD family secretion protein